MAIERRSLLLGALARTVHRLLVASLRFSHLRSIRRSLLGAAQHAALLGVLLVRREIAQLANLRTIARTGWSVIGVLYRLFSSCMINPPHIYAQRFRGVRAERLDKNRRSYSSCRINPYQIHAHMFRCTSREIRQESSELTFADLPMLPKCRSKQWVRFWRSFWVHIKSANPEAD